MTVSWLMRPLYQTLEVLSLSLFVIAIILIATGIMRESVKTMCNSSYQIWLTKSEECRNCSDLCATFDDALCLEFCSEYYSNNLGNATQSINMSTWDSYSLLEDAWDIMHICWINMSAVSSGLSFGLLLGFITIRFQVICPFEFLQTIKDIQSKSLVLYLFRFRQKSRLIKVREPSQEFIPSITVARP